MITFDGDRSRKRQWLAKKKIGQLKDIRVPAGALNWGGFQLRYWQQGELSGGRVTAPMGAAICKVTADGAVLLVADAWTSGVDNQSNLHTVLLGEAPTSGVFVKDEGGESELERTAAGDQTFPFVPRTVLTATGLIGGTTIGAGTLIEPCKHPIPVLTPCLIGEYFWVALSGYVFLDLDGNGVADKKLTAIEIFLDFYNSDGSPIGNRYGVAVNATGDNQPLRVLFALPTSAGNMRYVSFNYGTYEVTSDDQVIVARSMTADLTTGDHQYFTGNTLWTGVPAGLLPYLLDTADSSLDHNFGGYVFSQGAGLPTNLLHWVSISDPFAPANAWFTANPSQAKWHLFYTMTVNGTTYTIDSSQFIATLDTMATVPILGTPTNWVNARRMMRQLYPWPNANPLAPYDGAMFHDLDNNVYTWTRAYFSCKWTTTGMSTLVLFMPSEVTSTDGVRPELSLSASGKYLCVCNNVGVRIEAIYYGTPFTAVSWSKLADLPVDYELKHVRPVIISDADIVLLGVAATVDANFFCVFREGAWTVLSQLPGTPDDDTQWATTLFGEGQYALNIQEVLSPPHVMPQMPVSSDYSKYAIGMP